MKTTIVVEIAQKAAILAGKKEYGRQFVEIDPALLSENQRKTLLLCPTDGANDHPGYYYKLDMGDYGETTPETIAKRLDEIADEKEQEEKKRQQEIENQINTWLTMPEEEFASLWINMSSNALNDPRMAAKKETREKIREEQERIREIEAIEKADRKAQKEVEIQAEKEKIAQQKKDYIHTWVEKNGTESQKERYSADLLPLSEVLDLVEEQIFLSLVDEERYEKMKESEVDHSERCDEYGNEGCEVSWDVEDAENATAEEWDRMKFLKKKFGREDVTVTLRIHTGETGCKETTEKKGILIKIEEGGYSFSREYAV